MIDIKDISGSIRFSTRINEGSKRKFLLMKEDYITLSFSLETPVHFKLGDYVDFDSGLFEVCDLQQPTFNTSTGGCDYELRLDAYYWKWKNKIFKYTPETGGQEASWNLTASLDVQLGIVLRNLKALGYTYKGQDFVFSIDSSVENKSQSMIYDNINILDACFSMAKKWDCECWVTENIIHFGRCEHSDPVDFELGVNVENMTRSDSRSDYATRIYAFGSTRNLPSTYRKNLLFDVKELPSVSGYRAAVLDTARKLLPAHFRSANLFKANLTVSSYAETKEMRVPQSGYQWNTTYSLTERPGNTYAIDFSEFSAYVTGGISLSVEVSLGVILCDSVSDENGKEIELASLSFSDNKRVDIPVSSFSQYTFKSSGKFFLKVFQRIRISGKDLVGPLDVTGWCNGKFSYREAGTAAHTAITFTSGPSAGKAFDAVYNPEFRPDDDAGIIAINGTPAITKGDSFTLSGLIRGKVPASYFTGDIGRDMTVNGVVQKRLMLPEGIPYIDAYEGMTTEEAVEGIVVYDDIYPRRIGTVSDITTHEYTDTIENADGSTTKEKWNAYRFKDTGIIFSEDYVLPGEELKITFQSGSLNGMEFAVTFNPCDKEGGETPIPEKLGNDNWNPAAQVWEIVANEDYGRRLPDETLKPKAGDTYVLSGFDTSFVSEAMIPEAEKEVEEKARKDIEKMKVDPSTYEATMMSDCVYSEDGHKLYDAGARVNLVHAAYFKTGSRQSRIIGFEYNLDLPYDSPVYTVGETAAYSRIAELENKIENVTLKGQTYTGGGGSGIYLITSNDSTPASDSNTYSAKRILKELGKLLRKDREDETNFLIKFLGGLVSDNIESQNFSSGPFGSGYLLKRDPKTGKSYLEVDELFVRIKAMFSELEIKKLSYTGGNYIFSAAGMKCAGIEDYDGYWRCYLLVDDGETAVENPFREGDQVRFQEFNIKPGVHEGVSNRYYWRLCVGTGIDFIDLSKTDCDTGSDVPQIGDSLVQLGNRSNAGRQNAITLSVYGDDAPSIRQYAGIDTYSMAGKEVTAISPSGNRFTGDFILKTGVNILTRFQAMEDLIYSEVSGMRDEIQSKDNYLSNSAFATTTVGWQTTNKVSFFTVGGRFLYFNDNFYSSKKIVSIVTAGNRKVLRIVESGIRQLNADMARKPAGAGSESPRRFFISFRCKVFYGGTLTLGFPDQNLYFSERLEPTDDFMQKEYSGTWDGTGDFELNFSGGIYLHSLALTDNAYEDLLTRFETEMVQTNDRITLLAKETTEAVGEMNASIKVTAENIVAQSERIDKIDGTIATAGWITSAEGNTWWASKKTENIAANVATALEQTNSSLSAIAGRFNPDGTLKEGAGWVTTADANTSWVKKDNVISCINQSADSVKIQASKIELDGITLAKSLMVPIPVLPYAYPAYINFSTGFNFDVREFGINSDDDTIYLPSAPEYEGAECTVYNSIVATTRLYRGVRLKCSSGDSFLNLKASDGSNVGEFPIPLATIVRLKAVRGFHGDTNGVYWYILNPEVLK